MRLPPFIRAPLALLLFAVLATACASSPVAREPDETDADPQLAGAGIAHVVVAETFITPATSEGNIDSPALWIDKEGRPLLLATAKAGDRLMLYDGDSGTPVGHRGASGDGPGQFERPNGIFVIDDLVFVVERDNRRVQVLRLPTFESLGSFGEGLRQPYGIWVGATATGGYDVLVSDAYMAGEDAAGKEIVPPLHELGARIRRYSMRIADGHVQASTRGTIGATDAEGAIRIPESLWADPAHDRLLIAEEDVATGTALREYGLTDGRYRGRTLGLELFRAQAEGIALWACTDGSGYWIATDQFEDRSLFHVFDRESLRHLGAFAGETTGNTDGVWLSMQAGKRFPKGVFYAVHDDMAVAAFDWRDIAAALDLRASCPH